MTSSQLVYTVSFALVTLAAVFMPVFTIFVCVTRTPSNMADYKRYIIYYTVSFLFITVYCC